MSLSINQSLNLHRLVLAGAFLSLEDKIMDNYLPKKIKLFLQKNIANKHVQNIAVYLYKYFQNKIEKQTSSIRQKTLAQEFDMNNSMSFTD